MYSNLDAAPHPEDTATIAARLGAHLAGPVLFADMIEAMHRDGARVFVEVGPGSILTPLVESVLGDRPHLAVSSDSSGASGLPALLRCIARLVVGGLPLRLERLTLGRSLNLLDLRNVPAGEIGEAMTPSTWLVNGSRARPHNDPEPKRLGMASSLLIDSSANATQALSTTIRSRVYSNASLNMNPRLAKDSPGEHSNGSATSFPHDVPKRNGQADTHTIMPPPASTPRSEKVIESFQQTMQMFLDVQKSTMLAYLNGRAYRSIASGTGHPNGSCKPRYERDVAPARRLAITERDARRSTCRSSPSPSGSRRGHGRFSARSGPWNGCGIRRGLGRSAALDWNRRTSTRSRDYHQPAT